MKVRCIFNKNTELPELIEKYGYFERSVLHITKGKEYTVYAIRGWHIIPHVLPTIEYYIKDDLFDQNNGISNYCAKLFEIVDSDLGDCDWHYSLGKKEMDFLIGYKEFVSDPDHFGRFVDIEKEDIEKFLKWCDVVDKANEKI
jgi:hypothetical protein